MRTGLAFAVLAVLLAASSARAEGVGTRGVDPESAPAPPNAGFGARGDVILSVERIVPLLTIETIESKSGVGDATQTRSTVAVGTIDRLASSAATQIPRPAVDVVIFGGVTAGSSVFFSRAAREGTNMTLVGISPRLGWALPLGARWAIWPRAGIHLLHVTESGGGTSSSQERIEISVEPAAALFILPHVAATFSPMLDLLIVGDAGHDDRALGTRTSIAYTGFRAGLHLGFLGHF